MINVDVCSKWESKEQKMDFHLSKHDQHPSSKPIDSTAFVDNELLFSLSDDVVGLYTISQHGFDCVYRVVTGFF